MYVAHFLIKDPAIKFILDFEFSIVFGEQENPIQKFKNFDLADNSNISTTFILNFFDRSFFLKKQLYYADISNTFSFT